MRDCTLHKTYDPEGFAFAIAYREHLCTMAEPPRNLQLPSGYDEEFTAEVEDDFLCLICHLPLREPVQTRCGHRFCNACLEKHFRR